MIERLLKTVSIGSGLLMIACYGDMVSTQPAGERFEGVPIDPTLSLTCADPVETIDDGHHNEGVACLGCHNGVAALAFTAGGTLYADPGGTTPLTGFKVSIIDADETPIDAFSALNGNFYATAPIVFPAVAFVSACPDVVPMPIQLTVGDCNSCHVVGDRITFAPN
jgi:hypothetical protein